jgi:hypothetical protein
MKSMPGPTADLLATHEQAFVGLSTMPSEYNVQFSKVVNLRSENSFKLQGVLDALTMPGYLPIDFPESFDKACMRDKETMAAVFASVCLRMATSVSEIEVMTETGSERLPTAPICSPLGLAEMDTVSVSILIKRESSRVSMDVVDAAWIQCGHLSKMIRSTCSADKLTVRTLKSETYAGSMRGCAYLLKQWVEVGELYTVSSILSCTFPGTARMEGQFSILKHYKKGRNTRLSASSLELKLQSRQEQTLFDSHHSMLLIDKENWSVCTPVDLKEFDSVLRKVALSESSSPEKPFDEV